MEKTYSKWVNFEMRWGSGGVGCLVELSAYTHRKTFQSCCEFAALCSCLFGCLMVSSPPLPGCRASHCWLQLQCFVAANNGSTWAGSLLALAVRDVLPPALHTKVRIPVYSSMLILPVNVIKVVGEGCSRSLHVNGWPAGLEAVCQMLCTPKCVCCESCPLMDSL